MAVWVYANVDGVGMLGQRAAGVREAADYLLGAARRARRLSATEEQADQVEAWVAELCRQMVASGSAAVARGEEWSATCGLAHVSLSPRRASSAHAQADIPSTEITG
ncbi:hypothetical protein ACIF70_40565 [Actinacidiphila glaucinigra]|uniref:hypothetical protein n=1 Tax=Actinacidiphila glaucinigra TaxID=235986 RepID=UPI0037CB65BA